MGVFGCLGMEVIINGIGGARQGFFVRYGCEQVVYSSGIHSVDVAAICYGFLVFECAS